MKFVYKAVITKYHSQSRQSSYNYVCCWALTASTQTAGVEGRVLPDNPTPGYTAHHSQTSTCLEESLAYTPVCNIISTYP